MRACVYMCIFVCVCVKELILSRFAGEMRKCLYPSGTTNQATVLCSHSSSSVGLSLSLFLTISESKLAFLCGCNKVSLALLLPEFSTPRDMTWTRLEISN